MNGWRSRAAAAAVLALLAAGCATPQPTTPAAARTTARRDPTSDHATARVIVVVEENHSFDQIIGNARAPFLNHLAGQGTLLTSYFAITHPSLPNYIAMVSGDTQGITSDCGDCNVNAANLADQLEGAGISWKAYMEDLPAACSDAHHAGAYAKKHDPFMYFASVRDNPDRCAKVVPFGQLDADLTTGRLPQLVFITPNQNHDMHGAGEGRDDAALIATADHWLEGLYGRLAGSSAWRQGTRLVVTWDEGAGGTRTGCCGGLATGGNVATIITGPGIKATHDATTYSHYALLRSIETLFHLSYLSHAGDPGTPTIAALT